MPTLNHINAATLCFENRQLLQSFPLNEGLNTDLINIEGFIDLSPLTLEQKKNLVDQIIDNEEFNIKASKKKSQELKYTAKNIIEFLTLSLALLVAGLALAPLFFASFISLPILPILLFGVAIIAITKLVLNRKINQLESIAMPTDKALNQLIESSKVNEEISNDVKQEIRKMKDATLEIENKIDALATNSAFNFSELLANQGTFSKTIPPSPSNYGEPANLSYNKNMPSSSQG